MAPRANADALHHHGPRPGPDSDGKALRARDHRLPGARTQTHPRGCLRAHQRRHRSEHHATGRWNQRCACDDPEELVCSRPEMTRLFAVIRSHGPAWRESVSLEGQEDWDAHASFMNALEKEGFVVLGGPLEGTADVLLIIRAAAKDEILDRLSGDPWTAKDLLRVSRVTPWNLRIGSL